MLRVFVVLVLASALTACSHQFRQDLATVLQGTADRMGQTQTLSCRTSRYGSRVSTFCY